MNGATTPVLIIQATPARDNARAQQGREVHRIPYHPLRSFRGGAGSSVAGTTLFMAILAFICDQEIGFIDCTATMPP